MGKATGFLEKALAVGGEAAITLIFRVNAMSAQISACPEINLNNDLDTIVYEMSFKFGRADIVIFHADGSASVIEVKDGSKGYNHVVAGIGQAGLYAAQLGMSKGALSKVRKCLLWTSVGNLEADVAVTIACEQSNTIPLAWGSLQTHLHGVERVFAMVNAGASNGA